MVFEWAIKSAVCLLPSSNHMISTTFAVTHFANSEMKVLVISLITFSQILQQSVSVTALSKLSKNSLAKYCLSS